MNRFESVVELMDRLCRALILGSGSKATPSSSSLIIGNNNVRSFSSDHLSMLSTTHQGSHSNTTMMSNNSSEVTEKLLKKIKMNCFSYLIDKNDNVSVVLVFFNNFYSI